MLGSAEDTSPEIHAILLSRTIYPEDKMKQRKLHELNRLIKPAGPTAETFIPILLFSVFFSFFFKLFFTSAAKRV